MRYHLPTISDLGRLPLACDQPDLFVAFVPQRAGSGQLQYLLPSWYVSTRFS